MKKTLMTLSSLAALSTGFAAMDMDARVDQLESQMSKVRTETTQGTYGAQTASARAEVDGRGWFITFDLLYWHAKVGGTEYAYSDSDATASLPVKGRTKSIDFEWDWGLRAGLGYNFDYDGWEARGQYTWFDSDGSDSTRSGQNSSVVPLRGSSTVVTLPGATDPSFLFCTSAKSHYNFDYQAIDLELGRAYFLTRWLSVRPYWGLKTAWIDQQQVVRYTGGSPVGTIVPGGGFVATGLGLAGTTVHVKDSNDFWGIGPRVGFDSNWHIGNGFSIFGNLAGALLYGFFEVDHKEKWTGSEATRIKIHANRNAFSPHAQMQIGLHYDTYMHKNQQHLGIGLGFEVNYWWRQNQMLKIDDSTTLKYERYSEDVTMYGLTLDIKWDF